VTVTPDKQFPSKIGDVKLEKLKVYAGIAKWFLTSVVIGGASLILNNEIQQTQLQQQKELQKTQLQLKKQEQEGSYLAQFVEHALNTDLETRIKFAHYFSTVTVTEDIKSNWMTYYDDLVKQRKLSIDALQERNQELRTELESKEANIQRVTELEKQILRLEAQTFSDPSISFQSRSTRDVQIIRQNLSYEDIYLELTSQVRRLRDDLWEYRFEIKNRSGRPVFFSLGETGFSGFVGPIKPSFFLTTSPGPPSIRQTTFEFEKQSQTIYVFGPS